MAHSGFRGDELSGLVLSGRVAVSSVMKTMVTG
jgi:hypothetical protein